MRVGAIAGSNGNVHGVVCMVVSKVQMKRRAGWRGKSFKQWTIPLERRVEINFYFKFNF